MMIDIQPSPIDRPTVTRRTGRPFCSTRRLIGALAMMFLVAWPISAIAQGNELRIPAVPKQGNFIVDFARMVHPKDAASIGKLQEKAFNTHDTPIMVVTIESKEQYGGGSMSIEHFAYEWFNKWQIGKKGESGELINKGVLLLVSKGDRKARIELGADWGRKWDAHCAQIMNGLIIPHFKRGEFSEGIVAGAEALAEMAAKGPEGEAPKIEGAAAPSGSSGSGGAARDGGGEKPAWAMTPLPMTAVWGLAGLGAVLFVAGFFVPAHGDKLMMLGIALIVGAFFLYVIFVIVALVFGGRGRHYGGGGGGFSSGGGFSTGGFSGGGGATGSW